MTDTEILQRADALLPLAHSTIAAFRAAGVTARLCGSVRLDTSAYGEGPEVSGWFSPSTPGPAAYWAAAVDRVDIYTLSDKGERIHQVTAPTVAEAVALAAQNPVLEACLEFE